MKHWDGRDRDHVVVAEQPRHAMPPAWRNGRLSRRDRARLALFFAAPAPARRRQPRLASVIGLVLAVGMLVGLAWALAPGDPVSSKILN